MKEGWDNDWIKALDPDTPKEDLAPLATHKLFGVRSAVHYNPNATEEIQIVVRSFNKFGRLTK